MPGASEIKEMIQLEAARKYASLKFSLIPLVSQSKYVDSQALRESGHVNLGGKPAWHSLIKKPAGAKTLQVWFSSKVRNIGILGSREMVIFDFDDEQGYETWKQVYPEIARQLPTQKTQRGYHILVAQKGGIPTILRKTFHLAGKGNPPLGDVLGLGRYCLAWPSIHPSGFQYYWLENQAPWEIPLLRISKPEEIGLSIRQDWMRFIRFLWLLVSHPVSSKGMVKRKILSFLGERTDENRDLFEGKG